MRQRFIVLGKHIVSDELYEIYDIEKGVSLGYIFKPGEFCERLNNKELVFFDILFIKFANKLFNLFI
jgi:hypothetical protein